MMFFYKITSFKTYYFHSLHSRHPGLQ